MPPNESLRRKHWKIPNLDGSMLGNHGAELDIKLPDIGRFAQINVLHVDFFHIHCLHQFNEL